MPAAGLRARLKLGDGFGGFVLGKRFAVPAVLVLQERNAGAFVSFRDDGQRLVVQTHAAQHFENFLDVVAVHILDAPAERLEPFAIDADVVAERGGLALAETVRIHDGDEIVQLVNAGERGGFPDRAFGEFAVAEQDVGVVIEIVQPRGQRHADADAEALAERAGGHIHKRQPRGGMAFEVAAELAQLQQFSAGNKPVSAQAAYSSGAAWPLERMNRSLL